MSSPRLKRPLLWLPAGLLAALLAYGAMYWVQTRDHRALLRSGDSELAWLRHEFQLTDDQYARVSALHTDYRPTCEELCRRITQENRRLQEAVRTTNTVTPEIEALLKSTGRARDDCRQAMLAHLYRVAAELPPDVGRRYLSVMLQKTCIVEDAQPLPDLPGEGRHHHHE